MKHARLVSRLVIGGLVGSFALLVFVVDIRPTSWLRVYFFRYYHLEQLGRYTALLNPVFALVHRPVDELPRVKVEVAEADLAQMMAALPSPYPAVFLSREHAPEVPARLEIEGQSYEATVRFRGKSPRHWADQKKSFRVDVRGEQLPGGVRTTHYIILYDRGYIMEAMNAKIARDLGLAVSESFFAWVEFDGREGVYLAVEDQDSGMLERNRLAAGNLYTEVELGHNPTFPFLYEGVEAWRLSERQVGVREDFSPIQELIVLVNEAEDETFVRQIPTLIDLDQFLRWQAHAALVSSDHSDDRHNLKLLRDPVSGKLVFLPTDPGFREYADVGELDEVLLRGSYNTLARRVLEHEPWRRERDRMISDYLVGHRDELTATMAEARRRVVPWLMRDQLKLHSNLRALRVIGQRERFMERHWELLGELTGSPR